MTARPSRESATRRQLVIQTGRGLVGRGVARYQECQDSRDNEERRDVSQEMSVVFGSVHAGNPVYSGLT